MALSQAFLEAFTLMDTRGHGTITLSDVFAFAEAQDPLPKMDQIRKIYNEFDEDGSGDIDRDEFLGMCRAIEKLTNSSTEEMADKYAKAQYRKLFELVDDGSGGAAGDSTISKDELKIFIDSCGNVISATSADVAQLLKSYPKGELDFEDFCGLVKRLIRGKSISQVTSAFETAKKALKDVRKSAMMVFEQSTHASVNTRSRSATSAASSAMERGQHQSHQLSTSPMKNWTFLRKRSRSWTPEAAVCCRLMQFTSFAKRSRRHRNR